MKGRKQKYRIKHLNRYWKIYKPYFKYSYSDGYILEHRYIYHIYLSILNNKITYLPKNKEVHHINENGLDNRIENLIIITRNKHNKIHKLNPGKRICNFCNSNKTRRKNKGIKNWYVDNNGFLCHTCYNTIRYYRTKFNT